MAGGDLLYIFAFIILPTAVLVSCIWALIMLRKGALLPERPVVMRDASEMDDVEDETALDEPNPIEETGEHVIIEPAMPAPATLAASASVVEDLSEPQPAADTAAAAVSLPPASPPVVEQTQELTAIPVEATQEGDAQQDEPVAPSEPDVDESVVVPDDASRTRPAAASSAVAPDVLIVPLDDAPTSAVVTEAEPADANTSVSPTTNTPRRQVRRVAQLRPTDPEPARYRPRAGQRRGARRSEE